MMVFMEGGKPEYLAKNPQNKDENQQQTQPTYNIGCEIQTWWWEASALIAAPSLVPIHDSMSSCNYRK